MIYIFCLPLLLLNRYKFKSSKRIRNQSVQEILDNEYAELRVDTRIKLMLKFGVNAREIYILDKKKNKITLIELGITSQDSLQIVETEKLRNYDLLANELGLIYKCSRASMGVEDGAKNFKPKNKAPIISQGGTTLEEPTNNINEESDLGRRNGSDKRN
ncbi:hypothetical protein CWI36_0026p0050 [Hamiltosporidium magnivora]|uniref:Uncharacterized protein n=1 Tax=Hamiltosporidium magnivora TaxID=148818 RepID=A0A4Q9LPM7_9MICR|nr:hypothetical protein CWI36_0026p0050 [Hamiltosporidium magnivora]